MSSLAQSNLRTIPGQRPPAASQLKPLGRYPAGDEMRLALGLPLRNQDQLAVLLQQLYDPKSPACGHFLSTEEFAATFAPTEADYAKVRQFAEAHHFKVTGTHPNRTLLDVTASVRDIEQAFHMTMALYQHPTENRVFHAPDREPSVEAEIPILSISGLDDALLPRPVGPTNAPRLAGTPDGGSAPAAYYWGYDFRTAYAPGVTLTGIGQAVGLFELAAYYTNDTLTYESRTGLPNVPVTNVLVDDFTNTPGYGTLEVSLDIEMAIAMAPGLSKVLVYEGYTPNDILNQMATDDAAKQLSSSWQFSVNANTEQIFEEFAAQGQSIFQSSGDTGAYTNSPPPPTDDPWMTCVGGTTLSSGAYAVYSSERVWNAGGEASSGGVSATWAIPVWQQGISMSQNGGSTTCRNIPDVSMIGNQIWLIASNGNQYPISGTSAGAPLWAGFMALVNQQRATYGQPSVGFANPLLYELARGPQYTNLFHDVTLGANTNKLTSTEFFAQPGYDLCTGWGSPNGSNLINALAQSPSPGAGVFNGGFELGNFTDWNLSAAGTVTVVASDSPYGAYVHSGTYGAYLAQPGLVGALTQTAATLPGDPYLISFWLVNPVGGINSEFQVWWNGTNLFDTINPPSFGWTNIQIVTRATATNTLLAFGFRQDAGAFGLDDVGVLPIPAPTFRAISTVSNNFTLAWNAWSGVTYQVQYTTNLASIAWQNLGPAATATNTVLSWTDQVPADAQRFYRVALVLTP